MVEGVAKKFSEEQLVVLTINDDKGIENIKKAVEKVNTSLPVLLDEGSSTVGAYRAYALPTLYLVDRRHKVHKVWTGSLEGRADELSENIDSVLKTGGDSLPGG